MTTWFCIPSKRPRAEVEAVLATWTAMGYRTAIFRDAGDEPVECDLLIQLEYPGYARAVNALAAAVLAMDPECEWIVSGGDDTYPDKSKRAEVIAAECAEHFGGTFAVMQPTGDRYAQGCIDRIAGSPWIGREWCERANGGQGPFWPEFTHMFVDEHCKRLAEHLGVYWPRPDLVHFHKHFLRESEAIDSRAVPKRTPEHLVYWNSQQHWQQMQAIFRRLEAQNFAPCLPIPTAEMVEV